MSNIREVREVTYGGALERELLAGGFLVRSIVLQVCRRWVSGARWGSGGGLKGEIYFEVD